MNVAFHTDRLRVYRLGVGAAGQAGKRYLFAGFRTDEDRPTVAVNALVSTNHGIDGGCHVEWLETASQCHRQDFARELLEGIARHLRCRLSLGSATSQERTSCAALPESGILYGAKPKLTTWAHRLLYRLQRLRRRWWMHGKAGRRARITGSMGRGERHDWVAADRCATVPAE